MTTKTATYHTPDYRTFPPEVVTEDTGEVIEITLCEELVEGRWEPFSVARRIG